MSGLPIGVNKDCVLRPLIALECVASIEGGKSGLSASSCHRAYIVSLIRFFAAALNFRLFRPNSDRVCSTEPDVGVPSELLLASMRRIVTI